MLAVLDVTVGYGSREGGTPVVQSAGKPAGTASQAGAAKQLFALLTAGTRPAYGRTVIELRFSRA